MSKVVFGLLLFAILIANNSAREIQRTKRQPPQGSLIGGLAGIRPGIGIGPGDKIQIRPPGPGGRIQVQPPPGDRIQIQPPGPMIGGPAGIRPGIGSPGPVIGGQAGIRPGLGGPGPITIGGGAAIRPLA